MTATAILPHRTTEMIVNLDLAERIADAMKDAEPANERLHAVIDRALRYLHAGRAWTLDGDTMQCQSERHDWQFYTTTLTGCDCEAGTHGLLCKHVVALAIILTLQTLTAVSTLVGAHVQQHAATLAERQTRRAQPATPRRQRVAKARVAYVPSGRSQTDAEYAATLAKCDDLF